MYIHHLYTLLCLFSTPVLTPIRIYFHFIKILIEVCRYQITFNNVYELSVFLDVSLSSGGL